MLRQKYVTLIGILCVMALYLWGHNTETSLFVVDGEPRTILQHGIFKTAEIAVDIGLVLLLLTLAGGIGRRALSMINFDDISVAERVVVDSMVGLGIISLLALTLGLIGQFNPMIWGLIVIAAVWVHRQVVSWLKDVRRIIFNSGRRETPWERFVKAYVMISLFAALLLALAPPFGWDGLNYHLMIPQRYVDSGAVGQHLDNHFFGFTQNMEMLYGLLMMIGTDRMPAILHFMVGVFGLIAIYNLVQRHTSSKAASLSVLVLMMSFNLWQLFSWSYVDLALMTYGAVAVIGITQWTTGEKEKQHWLALTAIAASLAAGVKYTAAPLIIALYLLILLRDPRNFLRNTLIFGGFGVLFFSPWLIKGLLLYENPVYPYIFDGVNWDATRAINFGETGKGLIGNKQWLHIIFLPFTATIFGLDKITPYRFVTGPFLLTLPFLLLIGWQSLPDKSKQLARQLVPLVLVSWLFWIVIASVSGIGGQVRLMLVAAPIVAALCGLAYHSVENWKRRPLDMVFILQATLIVALFFGLFDFLDYFAKTRVLEYHTGAISEEQYLRENVGILYDAMLELDNLTGGSRILFLWEPKTYYCPETMTCDGDELFDNWSRPLQKGMTPEELLTQWQNDFDYVLLFDVETGTATDGYSLWSDLHEFSREENALFPQFFFDEATEIWSDGFAYTIYQWSE